MYVARKAGGALPSRSAAAKGIPFRRRVVIHPFLLGWSARLLSFTAEKERSWSPPVPLLSSVISRTLFTKFRPSRPRSLRAAATRRPSSGCRRGYLTLYLASNWFSGKKGTRETGVGGDTRLKVMRRARKKRSRRTIRGMTRGRGDRKGGRGRRG